MTDAPPRRPKEFLDAGDVRLRRRSVGDAEGIAEAIAASLPELRIWMPWATEEATEVDYQRQRLERADGSWELGSVFAYVILDDAERVLGITALNFRDSEDAPEVGYWLRSDYRGRGFATQCVAALTTEALTLPCVARVEIHCDEANERSAAIPRRVGYRLDRIVAYEIKAPRETGRNMVWAFPP